MSESVFKKTNPLEVRTTESQRMISKYPDRIPVIVERNHSSKIAEIDKKKYLVPVDLTVGQFIHVIRKRIKLDSTEAIFIFIKNKVPSSSSLMSTIYSEYKDDDGFLYVKYSGENTFGN